MLELFDTYASLFKSWRVICYEHHIHLPGQKTPEPSSVTNLEDLLRFIQD